jgi:hypothetical protein
MNLERIHLTALTLTLWLADGAAASGQTFSVLDGAAAWPTNSHPQWVFGSTPSLGGLFTPFQAAYSRTGYYTMNAYQLSSGAYPANYPIIAFNTATNPLTFSSGQFQMPAQTVDMACGADGSYAVARFLVPVTGQYHVSGKFLGLEGPSAVAPPGTRTDVHLLRNSSSGLFDELVIGQFTEKSFGFALPLSQGETLDFAVGYGDGSYGNFGDSTGLVATIVLLPVLSLTAGNPGTLSWPTGAVGFHLMSLTNLPPAQGWTPFPETPVVIGHSFVVTNAGSDPHRFFRLKSGN